MRCGLGLARLLVVRPLAGQHMDDANGPFMFCGTHVWMAGAACMGLATLKIGQRFCCAVD
jgi:hypothetical protein